MFSVADYKEDRSNLTLMHESAFIVAVGTFIVGMWKLASSLDTDPRWVRCQYFKFGHDVLCTIIVY